MKKRLLALFLAFVMAMSLLPVSVFADGGTSVQPQGTKDNPITANSNGVTVNKYVSGDEKSGYQLTLEAYASNQLTTTTTTTPLDIVLVLDTSGSMKYKLESTNYEPIEGETEWSFNDVKDYDGELYYKSGDEYYRVKEYTWGDNNYTLLFHAGFLDWRALGEPNDNPNAVLYTGELYQKVSGTSKLDAMKTAVNNFIDSVKTNSLKDENVHHRIGIVEFASNGYIKANLTNVETEADSLKTTVNSFVASGATAVDYALGQASNVLSSARSEAKKVVVLFTDGEPNHQSGFDYKVAADAINTAQNLKDKKTTVYTIGMFEDADPSDISGDFNKYMNAVSSRYPQAAATGGTDYHDRTLTVAWGKDTKKQYYFAADSAESLDDVFKNIANEVTTGTLTSNPDEDAVLSDTLSDYFNFPNGLTGADLAGVTVQKVPVAGKSDGAYTWGNAETVSGVKVTVTDDKIEKIEKIEVTGFNYKENAVTEKTENGNTTYSGCKLVVTFPIEVDENACLETPVETGVYPTNSTESGRQAGLSYKSSDSAGSNDASTTLSRSPAIHLTDLDGNGTDVKVQVYVDGNKVEDPLDYITLTRASDGTAYDYIKTTVAEDGTINCDFNYDPDQGQHDCIDLEVTVAGSVYVLQGVRSYQDHGTSGTSNVTQSGGAYKIDNVTAVGNTEDEDVDCTIYLRTKYSVEYYQGSDELTEAPYNDSNVYVAEENITATTPNGPEEGQAQWMGWKNDNCKTSVTLPDLPTVEGYDVSGWYLGSATNTESKYEANSAFTAISEDSDKAGDDADDNIIKFYATTALKRYNITINYVDGENHTLQNAYTESKNSGEQYSFDVSEVTGTAIPFTIDKGETQYVFNQIKSGSLSGTVTGAVSITAEYLLDSDKDGTPDKYEATVTYKVVNGTWSDGSTTDKTEKFNLKKFDHTTNAWESANPTLGSTIPTGMQPDSTHVAPGAWDETPTAVTSVIDPKTYTYTFSVTFDRNTTTRDDYTLHYVTNGGNHLSPESKSHTWTKPYDELPTPVRNGYTFEGWYWDPRLTEPGTGDVDVNKTTVTLYAKWSEKIGPDDTGVSNWLETDEHNAYLTGYPDSTFRADRNMTRAEVAQMFYALLLDKNVTITKSFSDVPDDAWYATAVKTLASLGMMDGYPDGTFRPDEPITRAEFATVGLAFAYDPLDADCSYYDVSASAWYHTYVAQATTYGWIGGYPDNTFRPGNNITRVEVCVIVNNMLGRDADERYIDRHEDELVHFVDLSDSYWGYYTIMESTNTHEYTGSFTNEKWTDVK